MELSELAISILCRGVVVILAFALTAWVSYHIFRLISDDES